MGIKPYCLGHGYRAVPLYAIDNAGDFGKMPPEELKQSYSQAVANNNAGRLVVVNRTGGAIMRGDGNKPWVFADIRRAEKFVMEALAPCEPETLTIALLHKHPVQIKTKHWSPIMQYRFRITEDGCDYVELTVRRRTGQEVGGTVVYATCTDGRKNKPAMDCAGCLVDSDDVLGLAMAVRDVVQYFKGTCDEQDVAVSKLPPYALDAPERPKRKKPFMFIFHENTVEVREQLIAAVKAAAEKRAVAERDESAAEAEFCFVYTGPIDNEAIRERMRQYEAEPTKFEEISAFLDRQKAKQRTASEQATPESLQRVAAELATQLLALTKEARIAQLAGIKQANPALHALVCEKLSEVYNTGGGCTLKDVALETPAAGKTTVDFKATLAAVDQFRATLAEDLSTGEVLQIVNRLVVNLQARCVGRAMSKDEYTLLCTLNAAQRCLSFLHKEDETHSHSFYNHILSVRPAVIAWLHENAASLVEIIPLPKQPLYEPGWENKS